MTCDACGRELVVGDFPFCPHGRATSAIVPDDVPGGFWVENGFETPQKFYSRSEHEKALAARGLEIRAKYAGEHDKIMTNWAAAIDPYTLESAKVLLSRGRVAAPAEPAVEERIPITVTDVPPCRYRMEP